MSTIFRFYILHQRLIPGGKNSTKSIIKWSNCIILSIPCTPPAKIASHCGVLRCEPGYPWSMSWPWAGSDKSAKLFPTLCLFLSNTYTHTPHAIILWQTSWTRTSGFVHGRFCSLPKRTPRASKQTWTNFYRNTTWHLFSFPRTLCAAFSWFLLPFTRFYF